MKNIGLAAVLLLLPLAAQISAGPMDPPAGPDGSGSAMYRLEDIYNRLNTGVQGAKRGAGFVDPASGPGSTGRTLNEVMAKAPSVTAGAAEAEHVLDGKKYWGLRSGQWGTMTGSMTNHGGVVLMPGTQWTAIEKGYHDGTGYVRYDTDLVTGNIRAGVDIFGVTGKTSVVETSSGNATAGDIAAGKKAWVNGVEITGTGSGSGSAAPVAWTGQGTSYGDRDDGELMKGVTWPNPRFTNNGDGTVTDNLTGLVWLQRANVSGQRSWSQALLYCNNLDSGDYAWLSDGSVPGDWRLPNVRELQSLIDYSETNPALPDAHPFDNVILSEYWSSSIYAPNTVNAWRVGLGDGIVYRNLATYTFYAWPVRDP
jgi:hypothetical protein